MKVPIYMAFNVLAKILFPCEENIFPVPFSQFCLHFLFSLIYLSICLNETNSGGVKCKTDRELTFQFWNFFFLVFFNENVSYFLFLSNKEKPRKRINGQIFQFGHFLAYSHTWCEAHNIETLIHDMWSPLIAITYICNM